MQFQVPQFIETEAKVVGPLTLRQFLYLAGAGGISAIFFYLFRFWLWALVTILIGGIAVGIAFVKVNGRPLIILMRSITKYLWEPKFYLWSREAPALAGPRLPELPKMKPGASALQNLLLKLTTTRQAISKRELPNPFSLLTSPGSAAEKLELLRKNTGDREVARRVDFR